jgi:hypothetical protein
VKPNVQLIQWTLFLPSSCSWRSFVN